MKKTNPRGKKEPDDKKKPHVEITINKEWCKKCGICVKFCPNEVFISDDFGLPIVEDSTRCIKCMLCVVRCPDFAVDVKTIGEKVRKGERFKKSKGS